MNKGQSIRAVLSAALVVAGFGAGTAFAWTAPYSTPEGIMLVDVSKIMDDAIPQHLWRRLGDAEGRPLYTNDADPPGRSSCSGDCAKEFPPFAADPHARASGDFTIITRENRARQWAYQGKPLYRYSGKDPEGEPVGARIALKEDPAWVDPSSNFFSPKNGWRRAAFVPEKSMVMPSSVELVSLAVANGFGFVDAATHMTIYAVPPARKLSRDWRPVRTSGLALPVGDFSIITRKDDGTQQWAYHGEALYTFAGDYSPGEVDGIFTGDKDIHAALAYRNFIPAGLEIKHFPGRWPMITTLKGLPVYMLARYQLQYGGRETRDGYLISYNHAKSQGTEGCEGDCTVTWKPLLAPATAKGWGFWEVTVRADGSRQWTLKGAPVYTFTGDRNPGDLEGNNRYVIVFGGPKGELVYSNPSRDPRGRPEEQPRLGNIQMTTAVKGGTGFEEGEHAGAGFYWHTPGLF